MAQRTFTVGVPEELFSRLESHVESLPGRTRNGVVVGAIESLLDAVEELEVDQAESREAAELVRRFPEAAPPMESRPDPGAPAPRERPKSRPLANDGSDPILPPGVVRGSEVRHPPVRQKPPPRPKGGKS